MRYVVPTNSGPREVDVVGCTFMDVDGGPHAGWRLDAFVWFCGPEIIVSELNTGFTLARIPMVSVDGGDIFDLVDAMTDEQYESLCDRAVHAGGVAAFHRFESGRDSLIAETKAKIAARPQLNSLADAAPVVKH